MVSPFNTPLRIQCLVVSTVIRNEDAPLSRGKRQLILIRYRSSSAADLMHRKGLHTALAQSSRNARTDIFVDENPQAHAP